MSVTAFPLMPMGIGKLADRQFVAMEGSKLMMYRFNAVLESGDALDFWAHNPEEAQEKIAASEYGNQRFTIILYCEELAWAIADIGLDAYELLCERFPEDRIRKAILLRDYIAENTPEKTFPNRSNDFGLLYP